MLTENECFCEQPNSVRSYTSTLENGPMALHVLSDSQLDDVQAQLSGVIFHPMRQEAVQQEHSD